MVFRDPKDRSPAPTRVALRDRPSAFEQGDTGTTDQAMTPDELTAFINTGKLPDRGEFEFSQTVEQSYKEAMGDQYDMVRRLAKDQWGFPSVAMLNDRTNWIAEQYKRDFGRWPSATELLAYPPYQNSLGHAASGLAFIEPIFGITGEGFFLNHPINGIEKIDSSDQALLFSGLTFTGKNPNSDARVYDSFDDVFAVAAGFSPISSGGPGRRGSGAGRAARAFDTRELSEGVTDRWRGLLLEEPDEATTSRIVGDYTTEANSFWMSEGGSLDFDTFVVDRIRREARYKTLYSRKPGFQSEQEYMGGFRNAVAGAGINPQATLREVEAGATSGAGLAGFSERVGRTREARLTNTGGFGNQLAANMAATGIGRT